MHYTNRPSDRILELYYEGWKMGLKSKDIFLFIVDSEVLSLDRFNKSQPYFFNYVRDRMQKENISGEFMIEKTPELEEQFLDYVRHGVPYDKAAKIMNIPMATLVDIWFQDSNFKIEVDYALEKANVEVVKALHKKAVGYDKTLTTRTKSTTNGATQKGLDNGATGGEITTTSESIREEHIQPSVEAAKFWLINKSHDQWSVDGGINKEGNKGKILDAIDGMCEYNEEDKKELDK